MMSIEGGLNYSEGGRSEEPIFEEQTLESRQKRMNELLEELKNTKLSKEERKRKHDLLDAIQAAILETRNAEAKANPEANTIEPSDWDTKYGGTQVKEAIKSGDLKKFGELVDKSGRTKRAATTGPRNTKIQK